ncbi:MAG: AraC family transcriptional regulator [Clostridia bacterium]|nr:AraC family transcriptional regulator [Clostridia bacterium]
MDQLNYTVQREDGKPFLREYVYHVGSFHYNWHREIELLCVLTGRVEVCAEGRVYELEENDLLLINANVGHATLSREVDSTVMLLRIDPSFFKSACPEFERSQIQLHSNKGNRGELRFVTIRRCMALMLLSKFSGDPLSAFAFDSALYTFAWMLLRNFPPQPQMAAAYSDKEDEKNVHEMIRYLEEQYREKITLQDMAKRWNYSSTYASQLFKEYVGINFYDYLTRIRLRQATRDLSETNRKILDIAAENGFQDLKSFNSKFREIFGRSPSDYRKSLAEEHVRYDATFKKAFVTAGDEAVLQKLRAYAAPEWSLVPPSIPDDMMPSLSVPASGGPRRWGFKARALQTSTSAFPILRIQRTRIWEKP